MLCKNSFPRSVKDADAEKQRGDAFTWQATIETRIGALACELFCFWRGHSYLKQVYYFTGMQSMVCYCSDLLTDDVIKKLLIPFETSLATLS